MNKKIFAVVNIIFLVFGMIGFIGAFPNFFESNVKPITLTLLGLANQAVMVATGIVGINALRNKNMQPLCVRLVIALMVLDLAEHIAKYAMSDNMAFGIVTVIAICILNQLLPMLYLICAKKLRRSREISPSDEGAVFKESL